MKTILLFAGILFGTLFSSAGIANNAGVPTTKTKNTSTFFSFIRGHKQGKNTTVTWGMTNNAGINYFIVECTYEDPNDPYSVWQTVGMMPCTNHPIFKFTDSPVLPGTLNYRITAIMNDNSTLTSGLFTIQIR